MSPARSARPRVRAIAVLGLDLGGTSGVAWWVGSVGDRKLPLGDELKAGKLEWCEVDCGRTAASERSGAEEICNWWHERFVGLDDDVECWVVVEDFILRPVVGSTERVGLSSPRLAGLVEGMLVRVVPADRWARYSPARSKAFATSERLKAWGMWCRSALHSRDASKQIALHVAVMREGK